jgi:DNA invertase Pin-like site-specific DNA recombinase
MGIWSIYCRVSTEDQKIHGLSLPFQREACLKFAQEHNLEVSDDAIFLEQYSWWEYERPLLSQLLSRVRKWEISFVIFTKRDRVARDQFVFQKIKREVENTGAKIYFAEEKLTGNVAIDGFMWSTLVWFSEYEREIIKTRTQSGKIQAARQNRWAFSSIPFGYVKNLQTKELEIYEDEAKIVKYIFNTYLNWWISIEGLSKHLTDVNIPPPSLSTKWTGIQKWVLWNRKNAIYKWIPSTVARIFDKVELYSWTYTAFRNVYKKIWWKTVYMWERPKEEWINVSVPPIISKEEAEEIEDKMVFNKRFADKWKRIYLLKGKLLCDCKSELHSMLWNSRMKRKTRKNGSVYEYEKTEYRCSLRTKAKVDDDRRCKNAILSRKVEGIIIDTIKELFVTPEILFDYESVKYPWKNKTEWDNPNRYLELKETLEKMVSKIERSEELFIDGLITKDRLRDMKKTLDIKKEDLRKSIIKEEKYLHREAFMNSMIESWEDMRKEFYSVVEEFFDIASPEQIREIIDIFVDQIIISPNKTKSLTIRLKIPFDIALSNKYYEDEKITWIDDSWKEHIIMTIDKLVPKKLSLWSLHDPIISKEVAFNTQKEKDKDEDDDKTGKWGWWSGIIAWAIEKMIEFVERVKYKVSLESHQFMNNTK